MDQDRRSAAGSRRHWLAAGTVLLALAAAGGALAQTIETRYGHIVDKRAIEGDKGGTATGALVGGLIGLATAGGESTGTKIGRTAGGALLGGVIGNQVDRSKRHWQYTVRFEGGGEERFLMQEDTLNLGDCAAVAYGRSETRVHYASDYYCRDGGSYVPSGSRAAPPGLEVVEDAPSDPCTEAKRRLLDATDPVEIETLERKVKLICDS